MENIIGNRIKTIREEKHLTQSQLAEMLDISQNHLSQVERGLKGLSPSKINDISKTMGVSLAWLMGESEFPTLPLNKTPAVLGLFPATSLGVVSIPVISRHAPACAGGGFDLSQIYADVEEYIPFPAAVAGTINSERPPFMSYVEGDSMEEAGIMDGAQVLVNPSEPVADGEAALICYGSDGVTAVKLVYWQRDGGVEIRSTNPKYPPRFFSREDIDLGFFFIVGKVIWSGGKPKRFK